MHSLLSSLPASPMSGYLGSAGASPLFPVTNAPSRLLSLSLWAEGMSVYTADVDRLSAAMSMPPVVPHDSPPSILFRIKISISSIEDLHSSPNLHGFHGAITLTSRWTSSAQCITKLHSGQTCISQETSYLVAAPHDANSPHPLTCALPDSSLSRCKWLPTGICDFSRILQCACLMSLTDLLPSRAAFYYFVPASKRTRRPRQDHAASIGRRCHRCRVRVHARTHSCPWQPALRRTRRVPEIQGAGARQADFSPVLASPHARDFPVVGCILPGRRVPQFCYGAANVDVGPTAARCDRSEPYPCGSISHVRADG